MALSRKASGNGASGVAALSGTYVTGDLIVLSLQNTANTNTPATPTGYTSWASGADAANSHAMRVVYKYATSNAETMPTLTDVTSVSWAIYSGENATTPGTQIAGQAAASSSMSASGVVTYASPANDWVIVVATGKGITGNIGAHPPTSMVLVTEYKTGSDDNALFDSNAPLSSYGFNTKTLDASVSWITKTIELQYLAVAAGPTNQFFQAVRP